MALEVKHEAGAISKDVVSQIRCQVGPSKAVRIPRRMGTENRGMKTSIAGSVETYLGWRVKNC